MAKGSDTWIGLRYWKTAPKGVVPRVVRAIFAGRRVPWGRSRRLVVESWLLNRTQSDAGLIRIGSPRATWRHREPRTAILLPPGTVYWEDTSSLRCPVQMSWINLIGGEQAGLERFISPRTRFARFADPAGLLDGPLHKMAMIGQDQGEEGFWQAQAILMEIISLLHVAAVPTKEGEWILCLPRRVSAKAAGIVAAAGDYFRQHLSERVTVAAVARHLGMSPSSFAHRYSAQAGQSPMAALSEMRMDLARTLLLHGIKMEIIARQTGFCDAFHFSRAFRHRHGQPPSRFRDHLDVQPPAGSRP